MQYSGYGVLHPSAPEIPCKNARIPCKRGRNSLLASAKIPCSAIGFGAGSMGYQITRAKYPAFRELVTAGSGRADGTRRRKSPARGFGDRLREGLEIGLRPVALAGF